MKNDIDSIYVSCFAFLVTVVLTARQVSHQTFYAAAKSLKKQITPEVIDQYLSWSEHNGVTEA